MCPWPSLVWRQRRRHCGTGWCQRWWWWYWWWCHGARGCKLRRHVQPWTWSARSLRVCTRTRHGFPHVGGGAMAVFPHSWLPVDIYPDWRIVEDRFWLKNPHTQCQHVIYRRRSWVLGTPREISTHESVNILGMSIGIRICSSNVHAYII